MKKLISIILCAALALAALTACGLIAMAGFRLREHCGADSHGRAGADRRAYARGHTGADGGTDPDSDGGTYARARDRPAGDVQGHP